MLRVCGALVVSALVGVGCGGVGPGNPLMKPGTDAGNKDAVSKADVSGAVDLAPGTDRADVAAAMDAIADTAAETIDAADGGAPAGDAPANDTRDASDGGNDVASAEIGDTAEAPEPKSVMVAFTGSVVTVAPAPDGGMPLGFDTTVRTKPVTGSFSYNLGYLDDAPAGDRGKFERFGKMAFTLQLEGHTVTGSGKGWLETENLASSDTFRYVDGKQPVDNGVRTMKLDGVDAPKLKLFIAITDSTGTMLTSDALPAPFPTLDIKKTPHTFSLSDDGGTLLLQLDTLVNQ